MRMSAASLFAFGVLAYIYHMLVDPRTHAFRPPDHDTIPVVLLIALFGIIGFIWISGRGYSDKPKVSRYDH